MVKIDLSITASENCPRFDRCEINRCPLHPDYPKLKNHPLDPAIKGKHKCVSKSIRRRVGEAFRLKNKGLTPRELSFSKKWAEMPEEIKKEKIAKLKQFSPLSRCIEKGLRVTRKPKGKWDITQTKEEKTLKNKRSVGEISSENPDLENYDKMLEEDEVKDDGETNN